MSAPGDDDDLAPTQTQGYKVGEKKSMSEYAQLDANDESLNKWKASLGVGTASGSGDASGPNVTVEALVLQAPTRTQGPIRLDLKNVADFKKNPVTIKEGVEYSVQIIFKVNHAIVSGLRYIQVVKRAGVKVDKLESMIGSYGPSTDQLSKTFVSEESPSGMLARSGSYTVRSRVTDDDGHVHADFEWTFKLGKEW
ncbi:E set domain-containing protein [Atractiella rhizophila]|nr:E set domain-containing protein [Atractiella rhizophila]